MPGKRFGHCFLLILLGIAKKCETQMHSCCRVCFQTLYVDEESDGDNNSVQWLCSLWKMHIHLYDSIKILWIYDSGLLNCGYSLKNHRICQIDIICSTKTATFLRKKWPPLCVIPKNYHLCDTQELPLVWYPRINTTRECRFKSKWRPFLTPPYLNSSRLYAVWSCHCCACKALVGVYTMWSIPLIHLKIRLSNCYLVILYL